MNKVLDFHRLAMVLRWDALSNWKKYVRNTLGLAFVFSFICIWYQFNMRSNGYVTYNDVKDVCNSRNSHEFFPAEGSQQFGNHLFRRYGTFRVGCFQASH